MHRFHLAALFYEGVVRKEKDSQKSGFLRKNPDFSKNPNFRIFCSLRPIRPFSGSQIGTTPENPSDRMPNTVLGSTTQGLSGISRSSEPVRKFERTYG